MRRVTGVLAAALLLVGGPVVAAPQPPDLKVRGAAAVVDGALRVDLSVVAATPRPVRRTQVAVLVDGVEQARLRVERVRRGAPVPVVTSLPLPSPGSHAVRACVDPGDRVRERREGNNCRTLATVVVSAPVTPVATSPPVAPSAPLVHEPGVPVAVGTGSERSWVVVPAGYDPTHRTTAPVLVFLHGCFDTATNQLTQLRRAATFQRTVLVVPELGRDGACWDLDADPARLRAALADLRTRLALDPARTTLAGYSSGALLAGRTALADLRAGGASYDGVRLVNGSPFLTAAERTAFLTGLGAARFPVRWRSHDGDPLFPRATVAADQQALRDAGFPVTASETSGGHEVATADLAWLVAGID